MSLFLNSSGSNAQGEARALVEVKGPVSDQKALQASNKEMRELLGGTEDISMSPTKGH